MRGLTRPNITYKPFQYPWAMEFAEDHEKIHWGTWEVKLQEDVNQWKGNEITPDEKHHIVQILRMFTQSDVQVAQNYADLFIPHFKNNEIRNMLLSFANREGTHQRAYALLNDTLGLDESEYSAFLKYKPMSDKMDFIAAGGGNPWDANEVAYALAQACINEGVGLFSSFVMLLNFQRFGKMKGMCEVVEWSIRDETKHVEGMGMLFKEYLKENPRIVDDEFKEYIYDTARQAVKLEDEVIDLVFESGDMEGLKAAEVKEYIRYLTDRRLIQLGLKGNFGIKDNPLPWVDWIVAGDSFKNFFEGTVTDYNASGMIGDFGWT